METTKTKVVQGTTQPAVEVTPKQKIDLEGTPSFENVCDLHRSFP